MATKYEKLADYLRMHFIEGVAGRSRLPSVSKLMQSRNVSQATVERALGLLEAEGLISREPGVGCFTIGLAHTSDALVQEVESAGRVALPTVHLAVCGIAGEDHPMWEELVATHRRSAPGFEVQITYVEPSKSPWGAIIEDGLLIDLAYCPPASIEAAIDQDVLLDLVDDDLICIDARRYAAPGLTRRQQRFVVPYSFTSRVVLFAADRMASLGIDFSDGWGWADFEALCVRLRHESPGEQPFLLLDEYEAFCRRWVGPLVDHTTHEVLFRGEPAERAIEVLRRLYQDLRAFPLCSGLTLPNIVEVLRGPSPALCVGRTPWKTRLERLGVPALDMWPLPGTEIGRPTATLINYLGVYKFSRYPELAASFVDFVCGPQGQEVIQASGLEFPLYSTTGESVLPRFAPAAALRDEAEEVSAPATTVPRETLDTFQTTILNHEIERCLRGETGVAECVQRIHRRGTTLIRNSIKHQEFVSVRSRGVMASA